MTNHSKDRGAAAFTHALKEYGGGKSMAAGVQKIRKESKQEGFRIGVNYALQRLSLLERVMGREIVRK